MAKLKPGLYVGKTNDRPKAGVSGTIRAKAASLAKDAKERRLDDENAILALRRMGATAISQATRS